MRGTPTGSAGTDLAAREQMRRRALWAMGNRELRTQALADLDRVERLDCEVPIGEAADWRLEELAARVPISRRNDPPLEVVKPADIPEPWRSRMAAASIVEAAHTRASTVEPSMGVRTSVLAAP